MRRQAVKVRMYRTDKQVQILAQHFGCARWWDYGLNKCIETYKATGKGLSQSGLNSELPNFVTAVREFAFILQKEVPAFG